MLTLRIRKYYGQLFVLVFIWFNEVLNNALEIINKKLCIIWLYLINCAVYIFTYILYMTNRKYKSIIKFYRFIFKELWNDLSVTTSILHLLTYFEQALEKHTIILFISFLCTYTISWHSKSNLIKKASVPLWIYVCNYICTSEILNTHI